MEECDQSDRWERTLEDSMQKNCRGLFEAVRTPLVPREQPRRRNLVRPEISQVSSLTMHDHLFSDVSFSTRSHAKPQLTIANVHDTALVQLQIRGVAPASIAVVIFRSVDPIYNLTD